MLTLEEKVYLLHKMCDPIFEENFRYIASEMNEHFKEHSIEELELLNDPKLNNLLPGLKKYLKLDKHKTTASLTEAVVSAISNALKRIPS